MVMISGVCDDVNLFSACAIGVLSGLIYLKVRQLFDRHSIDDPMESAQIHGIGGLIGIVNVAIFGQKKGLVNHNVNENFFINFSIQLAGATALLLWAATISYAFFRTMSSMGYLRVTKFHEIVGIDMMTHTMSDLIGMEDNFERDSRMY